MRLVTIAVLLLMLVPVASARRYRHRAGGEVFRSGLINTEATSGSPEWDNRTVRARLEIRACQIDLDVSNAKELSNENLVCLLHSDALNADVYRGGVSQVLQARFDSDGRLKLRANGRRFGCGPLGDVISYGERMDCYRTTLGTDAGEYDWESACVAAGMIVLPVFDHDADAGDEVGVCAGPEGSRLGPPAVPRLATTGARVVGD